MQMLPILMIEFGIQVEPQFGFALDEVEQMVEFDFANGFFLIGLVCIQHTT